jgi:aryl-alcohol dehydrogenase-like predicted oxidoreductase
MELMGARADFSEENARRLLNEVLDLGINLIDTAPDYGPSEELIGQSISHRRDEYFLASKCGCLVDRHPELVNGKLEHDWRPENVRAGVEQSLRRLRTDRLDLVQIHSSPSRSRIESDGTVDAMLRLQEEGKVRFLGMSSTLPDLDEHIEMGVFDAFQIPYSALQPEHEAAISRAAAAGAATIIRGGVARGATAADHDDEGEHAFWRHFVAERRNLWERAELDELLGEMAPMEFMLRFVLSNEAVDTTIVGTSKATHLEANVAVANQGALPAEIVREAKERIARALL